MTDAATERPAVTGLRARQPAAVRSALAVLEAVAHFGVGVTAREVSDSLGLPKATTYRLLNLLVQDEYLVRTTDLSGFALGSKVGRLGHSLSPPPPRAARDVLAGVRSSIRGGVHLVRFDAARIVLADIDPDFPLSDGARLTRELDTSAVGRLLLAELGGDGYPSWSVTRPTSVVRALIAETASTGYARQLHEFAPGHGCLALPIRDEAGALVAGLAVAAPAARIEHPAALLDIVRPAAARLEPLLA